MTYPTLNQKRKAPLTELVIVNDNVTNTSPSSEELLAAPPKLLGFKKDQASVTEKVIDDRGAKKKSSCCSDYATKVQNSHRTNNRLKKKVKELKKTVNELQR